MYLGPCPHPFTDPECIVAAARFVQREYGDTGYRVAVEAANFTSAVVLRVRHADGSEFRVMADRYGNAWNLPDVENLADAVEAGTATERIRREEAFARIAAEIAAR